MNKLIQINKFNVFQSLQMSYIELQFSGSNWLSYNSSATIKILTTRRQNTNIYIQ